MKIKECAEAADTLVELAAAFKAEMEKQVSAITKTMPDAEAVRFKALVATQDETGILGAMLIPKPKQTAFAGGPQRNGV